MIHPRAIVLGSIALNLVLVAALIYQSARLSRRPRAAGRALVVVTNRVEELAIEPAARAGAVTVRGSPPFQWSQLESADALVYLANLRAIGCPSETIHDILVPLLADEYRRRALEIGKPMQTQFWELLASGMNMENDPSLKEVKEALDKLREEMRKAVAALEVAIGRPAPARRPDLDDKLSHLDPDQQKEVAALNARFAESIAGAEKAAGTNRNDRGLTLAVAELRQRREAEVRRLFTDAEWAEAELRRAGAATRVRSALGFHATPGELQQLAAIHEQFAATNAPPLPNLPDTAERTAVRAQQLAARLRPALGEARLAEFQRGQDGDFQVLHRLARRLDRPGAEVQWHELRGIAEQQAARLRAEPGLSVELQAAALAALREETARSLRRSVGERGWGGYQRHASSWLSSLNALPP